MRLQACGMLGTIGLVAACAMPAATAWSGLIDSGPGSMQVNFYVGGQQVYTGGGAASVFSLDTPSIYSASGASTSSTWSFAWNTVFDPDPFINANLQVTNESLTTQIFTVEFYMPVGIDLQTAFYSGTSDGNLIDKNGDGAEAAAPDDGSIYSALIDEEIFQTLMDHPLTAIAAPNQATILGSENFGYPTSGGVAGPSLKVNQVLGIRFSFYLTPGDTFELAGNFTVTPEPVPAPAGAAMIAIAGLFARGRRRRG